MGLLSSIGTIAGGLIAGPQGAAIGGSIGGLIDDKNSRSAARKEDAIDYQRERDRFKFLREDAEKGGFHPLEALRSAGPANFSTRRPRVMSSIATQNAFDQLDEVISGRQAKKDKREELRDELLRTQIDGARRTGKLGSNSGARFPGSTPGQVDKVDQRTIPGSDPGQIGERGTRREPTPDLPGTARVSVGPFQTVMPNPEAFETGIGEVLAGGIIMGPQLAGQVFSGAIDGPAVANSAPKRDGKALGELVRRGAFEWQWTKNGWKGRAAKIKPKITPRLGQRDLERNYN